MCNIVYILLFSWNNFLVLNIPWASSIYLSPLLSGTQCSLYGIYSFTFSKCHIVRIVQCLVQAAVTKIPSIWWHINKHLLVIVTKAEKFKIREPKANVWWSPFPGSWMNSSFSVCSYGIRGQGRPLYKSTLPIREG